jgi:predicted Rossmann-fold nucleotide-binding protein
MTNPTFSICVYCGSRPGDQPGFIEAARATGRWIGEHGGQLVYGGGRSGLMGKWPRPRARPVAASWA